MSPSTPLLSSRSALLHHGRTVDRSSRPRDQEGQTLAEYALILAIVAIFVIVALLFLGSRIDTILSNIGNAL